MNKTYNKQIIADLTREIKVELHKFTNLINKKCTFCSTVEDNFFYYEKDDVRYFVCSSCIIKLALNNLVERKLESSETTNVLLKKELQALLNYIKRILEELDEFNK